MITKLIIENFKAIERLELDLRPFMVFVGPNDSGKSTILQALDVLSRSTQHPADEVFRTGIRSVLPYQDVTRELSIEVHGDHTPLHLAGFEYRYRIAFDAVHGDARIARETLEILPPDGPNAMHGNGNWGRSLPNIEPNFRWLRDALGAFLSRFDAARLAEPSALGARLDQDGAGLAAVIDNLLTAPDREPLLQLEAQLRRLSPFVSNVGTHVIGDRKELLYLVAERRQRVPASQMSAGVLLLTALLAVQHSTSATRFLVEEPETGIHPRAAGMLVRILRELTADKQRQVLITTHSPLLLNHVAAEDVFVVTRSDDAGVKVMPMTETTAFDERSKDFELGELWYNVGERELVRDAK